MRVLLLLWWHHCVSVIAPSSCQECKRIEQAVDGFVGWQRAVMWERIDGIEAAIQAQSVPLAKMCLYTYRWLWK